MAALSEIQAAFARNLQCSAVLRTGGMVMSRIHELLRHNPKPTIAEIKKRGDEERECAAARVTSRSSKPCSMFPVSSPQRQRGELRSMSQTTILPVATHVGDNVFAVPTTR